MWREALNKKRYGRFQLDWRLFAEYPDYVHDLLAHLIVTKVEDRWGPQHFQYEAVSPFFDPVEDWVEPLPFYYLGLNHVGGLVVSKTPLRFHWPQREGEYVRLAHCECGRFEGLRPAGHRDGNFTYRCPYAHSPEEIDQTRHDAQTGEAFKLLSPAEGFWYTPNAVILSVDGAPRFSSTI